MARTTALKSAAPSMFGSESRNEAIVAPSPHGFAKSAAFALLARESRG